MLSDPRLFCKGKEKKVCGHQKVDGPEDREPHGGPTSIVPCEVRQAGRIPGPRGPHSKRGDDAHLPGVVKDRFNKLHP